jgi:hypothetical protein
MSVFAILLFTSLSLLLVSAVVAKPVGKNPGTAWPGGTFWGTNLRLENGTFVGQAWFGTRDNQLKIGVPPDPPDCLVVEFFDNNVRYGTWVKVPAANENWPVRLRTVGAAPSSGTLSSVMENADTLFVPPDFSVVLENTTLGLNVNLRKENKLITGLPVLATLYLDNAVNVTISPGSQTGNPGDNVGFTVTVNNTGRYDDTYSLVVNAGNLPLYIISPSSLPINAGSSASAKLTVTVGADNQVITVTAGGNYASANASCTVITTSEQQHYILTTSVDPLNSGSVTPAGGTYVSGDKVTVTANPASGYEFDHWSGDASGTATSVTVTMNSNENIIAHFKSTSVGKGGGLPWTWIAVGISVIIIVFIIVAVVAKTRMRRAHVLTR